MIALLLALLAPAEAGCTALVGGKLHLPGGRVEVGDLVWADGRIVSAGPALAGGAWKGQPCEVLRADGLEVTAGLVDTGDQLGVVEIDAEEATKDADGGGDPVRAGLVVADAFNPASTLLPVARTGGVTDAVVWPVGGQISGQAAWIVTAGDSQAEMVVRPSVAVVARLEPSPSKAQALASLSEILAEAREYRKDKEAWARKPRGNDGISARDVAALVPVVTGEVPLVVWADRAADLEALARFATTEKVRVVAAGAAEGWRVASVLAAAGVGVIVDPLVYGPGHFDQLHARPENAALLAEAGVSVALSGFNAHHARQLRVRAGNAVRGGMDHEAALAAVTEVPARLFGGADRGRLAVGAVADIALWSGDPLEISTVLKALWVGGEGAGLKTRQDALTERYRALPGTPAPALSLP